MTSWRDRATELTRFSITGALAWLVDVGAFNLLRAALPLSLVLLAKVGSVIVASIFSWLLNRSWTFAGRTRTHKTREFTSFMLVNAAGFVPPLLCLWVSHYLLGLTSTLADNISANVVGLILGTALRYFGYRHLVFATPAQPGSRQN